MLVLLALCFFAFLAGFVDAMVGGGGLVQLPALFILQPHLTLLQTLATNRTANFMGTVVATIRYIKRVKIDWRHLAPAIIAGCIGAFSGALLISYVHKEQFMPFIICALVAVLLYTIFKKELGLQRIHKNLSLNQHSIYALLTGLIIGLYDGIIGPGTGSFLIFVFIVLFGYDFLQASANAKVINCVTNFASLIFFISSGAVLWAKALPMAAANMLGNYCGSAFLLKSSTQTIKKIFVTIVIALITKLIFDLF